MFWSFFLQMKISSMDIHTIPKKLINYKHLNDRIVPVFLPSNTEIYNYIFLFLFFYIFCELTKTFCFIIT